MRYYKHIERWASFLTNGTDSVEIQCSRFSCGIDPPPGMEVSILDGIYFINGRRAWIEIRSIGDEN